MYLLNNRGGIQFDYVAWFVIAVVVILVIIMLIYLFSKGSLDIINRFPF